MFMSLHPTARTPWVATVAFAICVLITLLTAGTNFDTVIVLLIAAGALWLMAYIIAHLDVIILRRRYPDMARPFRTPFYPVPQIVGIVAMLYVIWNNSPAPELTAQIWTYTGTTLAIVLVVSALWVTLVMKKGLFTPETPKHALED
jgi:amino acid transporter